MPALKRIAWVTGSSSGIGAAIAESLLAQGWNVHGVDIAPRAAVKGRSRSRFQAHMLDLSDAQACAALAADHFSVAPIDAFVHAAGQMFAQPLGQLRDGDAQAMWSIHVDACMRLTNLALPALRQAALARGRGRILMIGSRVSAGMAGRSQYAASKAALVALTRSWGAELIGEGITVNLISPAATDTPMLRSPGRSTAKVKPPPIGRLIRPDEIASLASYLLCKDADAITGQDIAVCGGASLWR